MIIYSEELKFSPSVVKSVPRLNDAISVSEVFISFKRPNNPNGSDDGRQAGPVPVLSLAAEVPTLFAYDI